MAGVGFPAIRTGFPIVSGGMAYSPLTNAAVLEWFDLSQLTPGAVAAITGRKAGIALIQNTGANQPIASATSFGGTPGLAFDGVNDSIGIASTSFLSGISAARFVFAAIDTQLMTALGVIIELTASAAANDGGLQVGVNPLVANLFYALARGTVNFGYSDCTESLATARYLSACPDTSITSGCAFLRINGVAQSLTTVVNTCGPGNFAAATRFALGGRATAFWAGTLGSDILVLSGNAQDSDLIAAEQFVKSRAGL